MGSYGRPSFIAAPLLLYVPGEVVPEELNVDQGIKEVRTRDDFECNANNSRVMHPGNDSVRGVDSVAAHLLQCVAVCLMCFVLGL